LIRHKTIAPPNSVFLSKVERDLQLLLPFSVTIQQYPTLAPETRRKAEYPIIIVVTQRVGHPPITNIPFCRQDVYTGAGFADVSV
jgi:hypothetical protein